MISKRLKAKYDEEAEENGAKMSDLFWD